MKSAEFPTSGYGKQLSSALPTEFAVRWAGFAALLAAIAATSLHSYVLFHSLVEVFRIVVIFGIAALAWNARSQVDHPFLLVVGLAYPSIGILELLHTLAYKGMGVFAADANLPTQFWIAFRGYESVAVLVAAGLLARRNVPVGRLAVGFFGIGAVLAWTVLSGRFPDCFVEGSGLTAFKIAAEYVIAGIFGIALLLVWFHRADFGGDIVPLVVLSIVCDILAELAFTQYVSVYGMANLVGHLLLLASTYFLYRALVIRGIQQPQLLLFHHLNREKELLTRSEAELAAKVAERTAEVTDSNRRLTEELAERKRITQQLAESEEMLRLTRNVALDAIIVVNAEGEVVFWNPAAGRMFGYDATEAIGRPMHELIVPEAYRAAAAAGLQEFARSGKGAVIGRLTEMSARRRDGSELPVELAISAVQIQGMWHAVGIIRDITDRKAVAQVQERIAAIVESSREAIIGKTLAGVVTSWNRGAEYLYGYTAGEMIGRHVEILVPPDLRRELADLMARVTAGGVVDSLETQRLRKDGTRIDIALTLSPIKDPAGTITGISTFAHDITMRKAAERALRRLNRRLRLLSASNQSLLRAVTPEELLARMSRTVTEIGGFQGVWIGSVDSEAGGSVRLLETCQAEVKAVFGIGEAHAIDPDSPIAQAARSSKTVVFANRSPHPPLPIVRAGIALPLSGPAGTIRCIALWTDDLQLLDNEEIPTLEELAGDLNFGLLGLHIKTEKEHGLQALARAMEETVRAIASTVEMRDPYTAGHQVRVGELSGAIARELGLPGDRVHAVELAAMIHDLGKINVPAEILTRPGRLSEIEYSLIKTHPSVGYEIVKNIDFPWPIAQAMLQHHERLDGSGYPDGLKGDAIVLEARIIGAADLVEAMSSHRPYRPGLGIDAALAELSKGRGITFDADVVDACLRLFRDKGFRFSTLWGPEGR